MKISLLRLLLDLLLPGLGPLPTCVQTVTVTPNGSGQFRTIQEAINFLPNAAAKPLLVRAVR